MSEVRILVGDAATRLRDVPDGAVHCVVTSPPYWGLRDYGMDGQIGVEDTPEQYVQNLVALFREVRRVLRDDGTVWLNLGDSYAGSQQGRGTKVFSKKQASNAGTIPLAERDAVRLPDGLKAKDLVGIPWRVAFALQADGWYLRSDIIWHKPNPMPESVEDRPTRSHEYIFLLAKSARYYYDAEAIKEPSTCPDDGRKTRSNEKQKRMPSQLVAGVRPGSQTYPLRNKRDVWTVTTTPYRGAHFATFPEGLIRPCILAGTSEGGVCQTCGGPWKRKIKISRPAGWQDRPRTGHGKTAGDPVQEPESQRSRSVSDIFGRALRSSRETVGWVPGCACPITAHRPAVVLDPFAGAGTTGLVAARLGRDAVLVELNPEYAQLARHRIETECGLLTTVVVA